MRNKNYIFFIFISTCWFCTVLGHAQTINFRMNVQPQVSAEIVPNLELHTLDVYGEKPDHLDYPSHITFYEIRGVENQQVLVSADVPNFFAFVNLRIPQQLPIDSAAHYRNNHSIKEQPANNYSATVTLSEANTSANETWSSINVYLIGIIQKRDIVEGQSTGDLTLKVIYL